MVDPIYAILGMTIIAAGNSVLKKLSSPGETDKERTEKMMKDRMNDFFKTVKLCNKKEEPEYAYVKWASDYESYTIIGVSLPSGCDINALLKLESALENEFQNDVEILYDNQNYRVKIFKGHLGKPNNYPFEVVPVPFEYPALVAVHLFAAVLFLSGSVLSRAKNCAGCTVRSNSLSDLFLIPVHLLFLAGSFLIHAWIKSAFPVLLCAYIFSWT